MCWERVYAYQLIDGYSKKVCSRMISEEQIIEQINEVLTDLRPYFFMHGGNIEFDHYDKGTVYVKLDGACSGCPSSTYTLKLMVEQALKKEVPQVQEVLEVEE